MQPLSHALLVAPDFLDAPETAPDAPPSAGPDAADAPPAAPEAAPPEEPLPPGQRLAQALEAAFGAAGWTTPYRWTTPYGHAFECRRTTHRYDVELQLVDAEAGHWLVVAIPRKGLLRRFFGPRVDVEEYALLLTHLRGALARDPRFVSARWYDEAGWTATPRGEGAALPIA